MDFDRIKEIPFDEVLNAYGVQFTRTDKGFSGICPLPGHPEGEKKRTFSVQSSGNFFRCFNTKCNDASGGKRGGDVISFVALMDGTNQGEAAKKLADHFLIAAQEKGRPQIEDGRKEQIAPSTDARGKSDTSAGNGNSKGYMKEVDAWLKDVWTRRDGENDETYWKRFSRAVKSRIYESYVAGKNITAASTNPPK